MGKDYYAILGITKDATDEDIKKSYRALALKFHPDKNKAPWADNKFKEIAEAYEVLIDKKRRKIYNQHEEKSLKGNLTNKSDEKFSYVYHGDAKDTFAQFFGSSNLFNGLFDFGCSSTSGLFTFHDDNPAVKDPFRKFVSYDMRHGGIRSQSFNLPVKTRKQRDRSKDSVVEHDLFISLEDVLSGCTKKVKIPILTMESNIAMKKEEKVFLINVRKGCAAGTKIIFQKEGNHRKNKVPADVVFVLKDKPHPFFKRDGSNIKYIAEITLKQALCGCDLSIPTLIDKNVRLNLKEEIISPQMAKIFSGLGLPKSKESNKRGDLIVYFDIKFPVFLPRYIKNFLEEAFPNSS